MPPEEGGCRVGEILRQAMNVRCRIPFWVPLAVFVIVFGVVSTAPGQDGTVRQWVIRAPENRVLTAALQNPEDDALAKILRGWVTDGTATVVSDVSGDIPPEAQVSAKSGRLFDWVVENDQEFGSETGVAVLTPSATQKVFIGSSLQAQLRGRFKYNARPLVEADWTAFFSPCDERSVPWPYWWPETKKQPKVSWYQQKDFFVEQVSTAAQFIPGRDTVLGIMPRADDLEPDLKRPKTLDVILAQVTPGEKSAAAGMDHRPLSPHGRCTVLGFGVDDREAVNLLSGSTATHSKPLLDALLKKLAAGEVKLRLFTSMASFQGQRSTLQSVRMHSYPTEMPTIPSAWSTRNVGTSLEIDPVYEDVNIDLEFHPALPRREEWRCALEAPELFMWQPQFFVRKVRTATAFGVDGVVLLGAMRTPECQEGAKGIVPGETLVLMAKLDGMTDSPDDSAGTHAHQVSTIVELEAVVFDVPASKKDAWQTGIAGVSDDDRFQALMDRTKGPDVKLAAHIVVTTRPGERSVAASIEEVETVTEVDPPTEISPTRYRPTAMEHIPCGTTWEVETELVRPNDPLRAMGPLEVHVTHTLRHDVSPPREPDYEDMIAESRDSPTNEIPRAVVFEEVWMGDATLLPSKARFIGMRQPPGDALKDRLHVAFLRARVTEGKDASPLPASPALKQGNPNPAAPADPFAPVR
jgi:hypothetical protein